MKNNYSETELLFELVRARYGDFLNNEQLESVKLSINEIVKNAEALSQVTLDNSQEPMTLFTPHKKRLEVEYE
jgi:hypothetical protein